MASVTSELPKAYILVMGLTGAGKSTFIFRATGDESIPIGEGLESQTQDPAEYIIENYKGFEVHLIDTPGFDDSGLDDARVLQDIANWINYIWKDCGMISGVLYLYDITRFRIGGSGVRNIRMLEELLGREYWDRCTLLTTKWGETKRPDLEANREHQLEETDEYWKAISTAAKPAQVKRFANTMESALEIIEPFLKNGFVPQITSEMLDPQGPQHSLGATGAGKQVSEYLSRLERLQGKTERIQRAKQVLEAKFNENEYRLYQDKRQRMIKQQQWKRGARWTLRLVTWGGCIAATVVTCGTAAPVFSTVGVLEVGLQSQRQDDKQKLIDLKTNFHLSPPGAAWNASSASMGSESREKLHEKPLEQRELMHVDTSTVALLQEQSPISGCSSVRSLGTTAEKPFS